MKTSFKVVIVALVLLVGLMGAGKTTAQVTQYPGTPLTPSAQAPLVITLDEGKLITLPVSVTSGDVVMLETATTWSDVVRFCDNPLQDPCQSGSTTHVQVMSSAEDGAASTFIDEYTGHPLDASKLSANVVFIPESTTGPTIYLGFYSINSPETGPPVGGEVLGANPLMLMAPWLAFAALVSVGVAIALRRRFMPIMHQLP
jgi:hypothetical protein